METVQQTESFSFQESEVETLQLSKEKVLDDTLRRCYKCKLHKPITSFYKDGSRNGYLCKECNLQKSRDYYRKHKDKLSQYYKKRHQRNRLKNKQELPTDTFKCCSICKEHKPITDFHIDRSKNDGRSYSCKICRNKGLRNKRLKRNRAGYSQEDIVVNQDCEETLKIVFRRCKLCKKEKPLTDFHKNLERKLGRNYECKRCINSRTFQSWSVSDKNKNQIPTISYIKPKIVNKIVKSKIKRPKNCNLTGLKKKIWLVGNHNAITYVLIHRKTLKQVKAYANDLKERNKWKTDPFVLDLEESPYKILIEVISALQNGRKKQFKDRHVYEKMKEDDGIDTWRSYTLGYRGYEAINVERKTGVEICWKNWIR